MPLNLSKDEVARLSEEQLDAYARVHLDSERTRRELCDKASGRNRSLLLAIVAGVLGTVAVIWFPGIFLDVLTLALLFGFHRSTNRRIDALVRLLNLDRMAENQSAEQVAPSNGDKPPV
jgi:hypothetical protein